MTSDGDKYHRERETIAEEAVAAEAVGPAVEPKMRAALDVQMRGEIDDDQVVNVSIRNGRYAGSASERDGSWAKHLLAFPGLDGSAPPPRTNPQFVVDRDQDFRKYALERRGEWTETYAPFVIVDPEVLGGLPVFRGTRVGVEVVFDNLADGMSLDEILDEYETLDRADVEAVLEIRRLPPEP